MLKLIFSNTLINNNNICFYFNSKIQDIIGRISNYILKGGNCFEESVNFKIYMVNLWSGFYIRICIYIIFWNIKSLFSSLK